jgi:hypothetical protein
VDPEDSHQVSARLRERLSEPATLDLTKRLIAIPSENPPGKQYKCNSTYTSRNFLQGNLLRQIIGKSSGLQERISGTVLPMKSAKFRERFKQHGIRARGPQVETMRAATTALIADLQAGKLEGATGRLASIVTRSLSKESRSQRVVCLACTELPLAFPKQKTLSTFEHDQIHYVNTSAAHIEAAVEFACTNTSQSARDTGCA